MHTCLDGFFCEPELFMMLYQLDFYEGWPGCLAFFGSPLPSGTLQIFSSDVNVLRVFCHLNATSFCPGSRRWRMGEEGGWGNVAG
jgi:hypothetical protein